MEKRGVNDKMDNFSRIGIARRDVNCAPGERERPRRGGARANAGPEVGAGVRALSRKKGVIGRGS